jgi:hypothetical protein
MDKYKNATLERLEVMKKELEEKGETGTAEYRAIMIRIDLLKNPNTGEGGNQQGDNQQGDNQQGGNQNGGTVTGDDTAPKVEGIDVETKRAFDSWASSNSDKNPKWIKMVGNVGEVEVNGKQVTCVKVGEGKFAITGFQPPIIINN